VLKNFFLTMIAAMALADGRLSLQWEYLSSEARRADVTGLGVPDHKGDGLVLPMLVRSGNLRLEIGSSGGCRFNKGGGL